MKEPMELLRAMKLGQEICVTINRKATSQEVYSTFRVIISAVVAHMRHHGTPTPKVELKSRLTSAFEEGWELGMTAVPEED